ncbi:ABC transporter ATP-binding protein [Citrobacter koseri]|nr:ABC transporter ATP-binding protein [Citrobacter koseri]
MLQPLLNVTDLAKSFSGVWALSNVQLTVGTGEIHALLGENGAGKSTLLKALAGAQPQTRGDIWFNGETLPVEDSPVERQNKGIITIYQEFNLLPNMTVAENMFLGREPRKRNVIVDAKAVNQEAQVVLDYLQLNVAPTTPVARLSVAQQQMVEIARALTLNAKLIIMDEPSAALSDSEVESLHRVVRELKGRGVSIIYVTHRLHEVFQLCDRFTVFQDGRFTGSGAVAETNVEQLIRLMVGRDVAFNRRPPSETHHEDKPIRLAVKGLCREKPPLDPHGIALHDISFHVHAGEVLGIAGLVGAGVPKWRAVFLALTALLPGRSRWTARRITPVTRCTRWIRAWRWCRKIAKKRGRCWDCLFATTCRSPVSLRCCAGAFSSTPAKKMT